MPSGSNSRGRRYPVSGIPAARWITLATAYVQGWLYANRLPGSRSGGTSRKPRTGSCGSRATASSIISRSCPLAIEARCRSVSDRLRESVMSASNSGKCDTTVSSSPTSPSCSANASAVEVKLLLSE
jgi:hypothetical protein